MIILTRLFVYGEVDPRSTWKMGFWGSGQKRTRESYIPLVSFVWVPEDPVKKVAFIPLSVTGLKSLRMEKGNQKKGE